MNRPVLYPDEHDKQDFLLAFPQSKSTKRQLVLYEYIYIPELILFSDS